VFNTTDIVKVARVAISTQPQEADEDTIELLLKALNAQSWHNQGVAASMYDWGFAKVLMTLMKDGVEVSKVFRNGVQCEAAYALSRMVEGHSDAAEFFDDDERVAILTGLLLDGARNPDVVQMGALSVMNALMGLEDLDRAMHYGEVLFKAGIMDACLKIVSPLAPSELKKNASGAVANMCAVYTDCHDTLIEKDGIRIFATLAKDVEGPGVEKENAILVLYHLARCGNPDIAWRIATACNGSLLKHLKKHALLAPSGNDDSSSDEATGKRKLLEHSVDLLHKIAKKMAEAGPFAGADDDAPTSRKRTRTE
jgi:hypothetical protein